MSTGIPHSDDIPPKEGNPSFMCDLQGESASVFNKLLADVTDEMLDAVMSLQPDILFLASIIREVDGKRDKSATALADAILHHSKIGRVWPVRVDVEQEKLAALLMELAYAAEFHGFSRFVRLADRARAAAKRLRGGGE